MAGFERTPQRSLPRVLCRVSFVPNSSHPWEEKSRLLELYRSSTKEDDRPTWTWLPEALSANRTYDSPAIMRLLLSKVVLMLTFSMGLPAGSCTCTLTFFKGRTMSKTVF
jgi:hypothetical protein